MKRFSFLIVFCFLGAAPLWANEAVPTETDPVAQKRAMDLAAKLRCLVCQNQSIAESDAELAVDLRQQVREQIAEGKSDRDIITFMTDRYGDFVLYQPPVNRTTIFLWLGPLILLLLGGIGMIFLLRQHAGKNNEAEAMPLSDAERARAAALLKGHDDSEA
jgi:Uncharacterized protein involved in biosynthesis of c-type cytochromes